ncbi:MAG: Fic family protein [Prolixibacteraceae bacterium]|nr:Fic family protein [Prolixibacteraceae bacterium]
MKPPYDINTKILNRIASISEKIGEVRAAHLNRPPTELRKKNRIKTIQSSLEIEGNTLTVEQITDLMDNKRILAPPKDILEVKNAIHVYHELHKFDVYELKSLCEAHGLLMNGLIENPGKLRTTSVGIVKGSDIAHIAPSGEIVYPLMTDLFHYLKNDDELVLIKSCVFHYEFEFIHPFVDGNGRMGRLWQTLILKEHSPVFEFLPIESLIKLKQQEYYNVLGKSDRQGNSTAFIEFMLEIIQDALEELLKVQNISLTHNDRILNFRTVIGKNEFSRQDYLRAFKNISQATASRDLKVAAENGILEKQGDKRTTKYRFSNNN